MTSSAGEKIAQTLRSAYGAVVAAGAALPRRRVVATTVMVAIVVAAVLLVPVPSALQVRDWATSVGRWFPLAFLIAHVVVTVFPFPRTVFTLAAGLLFGPTLGITLAVTASTLSALLALLLVRAAGWQFDRLISHPRVAALDARLRQRGWAAVLSLRLIPAMPFAVLNYAAGASAVRVLPYTLATVAGLAPGTAAVVILGDALTGHVSPLLFLVSLSIAAAGVALLVYEVHQHRMHHRAAAQPGRTGRTKPNPPGAAEVRAIPPG